MQAHVELRQVEPEELHPAPERRQPPVGDPCRTVLAQARVDHGEIGREVSGGVVARPGAGRQTVAEAAPVYEELSP